MSTHIPSNGYGRLQAYGPLKPAASPEARPSERAADARPADAPAAAPRTPGEGLSASEQQMIDRYFPPSESLSMRIYGPGNSTREIRPQALGSRLDLRG